MKLVTASTGEKSIRLAKRDWVMIGKKAGWIKTAGVSVGVDLPQPRDVGSLSWQLQYQLWNKFKDTVRVEDDASEFTGDSFTGGINVYLKDESTIPKNEVFREVRFYLDKLKKEGFEFGPLRWDISNAYKIPVLRIPVTNNPDASSKSLEASHMSCSTWSAVLESAGLQHDQDYVLGGTMPIDTFINAAKSAHTDPGSKQEVFLKQLLEMAIAGKEKGAKEIVWG